MTEPLAHRRVDTGASGRLTSAKQVGHQGYEWASRAAQAKGAADSLVRQGPVQLHLAEDGRVGRELLAARGRRLVALDGRGVQVDRLVRGRARLVRVGAAWQEGLAAASARGGGFCPCSRRSRLRRCELTLRAVDLITWREGRGVERAARGADRAARSGRVGGGSSGARTTFCDHQIGPAVLAMVAPTPEAASGSSAARALGCPIGHPQRATRESATHRKRHPENSELNSPPQATFDPLHCSCRAASCAQSVQ